MNREMHRVAFLLTAAGLQVLLFVVAGGVAADADPSAAPTHLAVPFDSTQARKSQAAWAEYLGTDVETVNCIGMPMVLIPPGSFSLDADDARSVPSKAVATSIRSRGDRPNTNPIQRRVVIDKPIRIGATEVTIGQFKRFAQATGYRTDAEKLATSAKPPAGAAPRASGKRVPTYRSPGYPATDASPAAKISWNDATAFCSWLSKQEKVVYRLPSEAEWEYACRAGATTRYSFGDDPLRLERYAWYGTKSGGAAHAVGTRRPNAFGLFDMHGNAWEWCQDRYDDAADSHHVLRGGYWRSPARNCGCGFRNTPRRGHVFHGFRCVQTLAIHTRAND